MILEFLFSACFGQNRTKTGEAKLVALASPVFEKISAYCTLVSSSGLSSSTIMLISCTVFSLLPE
ncbi:hypothetical protein FHS90_000556 [Rufibacter quisquiliarum]|uniref:Uncharacterized protein n=1 Tax=Rufibacter quisquiliarum TaxID=1549639 RepID=A0A839G8S7_9BACT|nr:hypothetical protein [Rufibacter quisquiliarum]